jgi:hypothetical protein
MRKKPFDFKLEELVPFSRFALESYTADRPKFIVFSPDYGGDHLTICNTKMDAVDKIINPATITSQMKKATRNLYTGYEQALDFIDHIERYVDKAKDGLPVTVKDFEFSKTRKRIHAKDAEGAIEGLKLIEQQAKPHLAILEAKGYVKAKQDELPAIIKTLSDANVLQNSLTNQRANLVQENMGVITEFWDMINDILKSGKTIFKDDEVKIKEYTQAKILTRLRREKKEKEEEPPKA